MPEILRPAHRHSDPPIWISWPGGAFAGAAVACFVIGSPISGALLIGVSIGLAWCAVEWNR